MKEQDVIVVLYVPCPDQQSAELLSKRLLEEKLIFCSNLFQNMSSLYLWNGQIQQGSEVVMIAKTLMSLKRSAQNFIEKEHPYEQVVVMSFLTHESSDDLLKWAAKELKK